MFGTVPGYTPTTSAAAATLLDVYDPTIFNKGVQEKAIQLNAFFASGILTMDPSISAMASGPGSTGDIPFFKGIGTAEPNYSNDDPTDTVTPVAITGAKQSYRKASMNNAWSSMDLARELGLEDPLGAIMDSIGGYWATIEEQRVISTATGILLDNIANDAGDMVNAIHNENGTAATADNLITAEAVVGAQQTMGDHASGLSAIAMHSVVYARLRTNNLIDFIPDARGEVNIATYLGMRVVVDDSLAPRAGTTDGLVYTTILFSAGAIAYGQGTPTVPSEVDRVPGTGNGGGQDIIYSRVTDIIHPYGFSFSDSGIAGITPTYAELAAAAQWDRVYAERKNVGMAFLTTNG